MGDREAHPSAVQPCKPSDCSRRDSVCTSRSGRCFPEQYLYFPIWLTGSIKHLPRLLAWQSTRGHCTAHCYARAQHHELSCSGNWRTPLQHWTTGNTKLASPLEKYRKKPPTGPFCSCSSGPEYNFVSKLTISNRKCCVCPSYHLWNICLCPQHSQAGVIAPWSVSVTGPLRRKSLFHRHSPPA